MNSLCERVYYRRTVRTLFESKLGYHMDQISPIVMRTTQMRSELCIS
jgi:hypothetical protein